MDVSVRTVILSAEVSGSIKQMDDLFGAAAAANVPVLSGLKKLAVQLTITHPADRILQERGSGSYDKATETFFARAPIDYVEWAKEDWRSRVEAYANATKLAIKAIYKTRISEQDRAALLNHIDSVADDLSGKPPEKVAEILPVHLVYVAGDSAPPSIIYEWSAVRALPAGRVVAVPPAEAANYVGVTCSKADNSPKMFKLHRRDENGMEYREAWPTDEGIIEHKGRCGDLGRAFRHKTRDVAEQHRILKMLRDAARAD